MEGSDPDRRRFLRPGKTPPAQELCCAPALLPPPLCHPPSGMAPHPLLLLPPGLLQLPGQASHLLQGCQQLGAGPPALQQDCALPVRLLLLHQHLLTGMGVREGLSSQAGPSKRKTLSRSAGSKTHTTPSQGTVMGAQEHPHPLGIQG